MPAATPSPGTTYTIPTTRGTATVTLKGDDVTVQIMVDGVTPLTLHPQHIHAGTTCPTAAQDVNGDGFVDVIEGLPKYGPILVSLDSTINTGASSDLDFPVSDANGSYTYSAEGSRQHIQDEIQTALKLGTRHVIHGISPDANAMPLPSTVASLPGLPAWATLPVACGELHLTSRPRSRGPFVSRDDVTRNTGQVTTILLARRPCSALWLRAAEQHSCMEAG